MRKSEYMSDFFVNQIYAGYAVTKKKRSTAEEYFNSARRICDFCKKDFLDLTKNDARLYYEYLEKEAAEGKISNRTIKARFVGFRQLAKYILTAYPDNMEEDPFDGVFLPKADESMHIQRIPSLEEIDKLLTATKDDKQTHLILCMICRMGITAQETVRLKRSQIVEVGEGDIGIIYVEKDGKTETVRIVPEDIKDKLLMFCAEHPNEDLLFHNQYNNPLTLRNLDHLLKKYSEVAGIETKCSVKDLRNRAILSMLHAGADPKEVAQYAGIGMVRARQFVAEGNIIADCPANLVNFRIV